MKNKLSPLVVLFCMVVLGSAPTRAADVKFPPDQDPAFTFTMPDDWTQTPAGPGLLVLRSGDHFCALTLAIAGEGSTPDALHKTVFTTGKVDDSNKQEEVEIGGKKGTAFYGTNKMSTGAVVEVKLIIVKPDEKHIAFINIISSQTITPEGKAALEKVLGSVKFTAGK